MPLPDWNRTEDWEVLRLGGLRVPGIVKVRAKPGSGLDIKKPKGGKKATIKDDGDPPVELEAELLLNAQELAAFAEIVPVLRPPSKNGARDPLKIEHPEAMLWGVHNVTVADIDSEPPAAGGRKRIVLKLIEWAPSMHPVAASKKKPEDAAAAEIAGWVNGLLSNTLGTGIVKKPSSDAGKNL